VSVRPSGLDELPRIGPAAITLGVFDGVHRGHHAVVAATVSAARERQATAVALIFEPNPIEVLRPGTVVRRLAPPERTPDLLRAAGIDRALTLRFDDGLRSLEPEEFLDGLAPAVDVRAIVMTPDSAFGRARAGTLERMRQVGAERDFAALAVAPLLDDGAPISSSRIRTALAETDLATATRLLGRPPFVVGTVVHGDRRGHELGFPTANLAFDYAPALPALGIYRGLASVPERDVGPRHPALVSIGVRPTFHDDGRVLVEAYLLDWDGDLYDAELTVELLDHLREERRFSGVDELVSQMRRDEAEARRRFAEQSG
jgi:riboflavin kinase/FMN adenylyltransferase